MITLNISEKEVEMRRKYDDYLAMHISGVNRTYEEILKPILEQEENLPFSLQALGYKIHSHDKSKRMNEEYVPYLIHWYADEADKTEETEKQYRYAIMHHLHNNEHHWQYWVYPDDSNGKWYALDMSPEAVIEMLCDWHSFTLRDAESTAYQWYQDNKSGMILSEGTIALIEKYIVYLKEPL